MGQIFLPKYKRSVLKLWLDTHMKLISRTLICLKNNEISQILKVLRNDNPSNWNFCYLNFNSVRNKFADLQSIIKGSADIVSMAETKLDA